MNAAFGHLLLHLLLFYLGVSDIKAAATQSIIKNLPGFSGDLPFKLKTGYVGVGEKDEIQLFYYFIESGKSPKDDPLVLWLTGGPGCSGFSALIYEIGPFTITLDKSGLNSTALQLNPYSWTKWLMAHPDFIKNALYIAGDSYSGIVLPIIVQEIINAETNCKGEYENIDPINQLCLNDLDAINMCLNGVRDEYILESVLCTSPLTEDSLNILHSVADDQLPKQLRCHVKTTCNSHNQDSNYIYGRIWANDQVVQNGLKIRKGTVKEWLRCNASLGSSYTYDVNSTIHYHQNFVHKGYRVLVYSGDQDLVVPHLATQRWIEAINLTIVQAWRPYTVLYTNEEHHHSVTFATGAGHTASEYKPKECFAMAARWFAHNPL
ncbi:hypothetical protein FNV43_RR22228 [Rhamnella rubrinervis]|uniref:Serine carboxypeptidase-like 18 n=1 Tax=Rhamnella rubrinervis TaxID=2594499 RepID=A0A8K0DR58_9ROSA|nr:hypothetical protein FNV43_RR22228 [Rhamnella rubrinervis]